MSAVYRYRINLIATDKEIAYYNYCSKSSKGPSWNDFELEVLDSLRNKDLIDSLQASFLNTYAVKLNWEELFVDSNIYGYSCSYGGQMPEMRKALQLIVNKRNYLLLNEWLQSTNTEKQVYAIDGLYQLKNSGYKFTPEQERLINVVRSKNGEMMVCNGCFFQEMKLN